MAKPPKSPYHHLIPEIRDQRRRRVWYTLLTACIAVFVGIWIAYRKQQQRFGATPGASSVPTTEVIDRATQGGSPALPPR